MAQYLESLRRLKAIRRLTRILPAHGDVIDTTYDKLDEYLKHRAARERQILKFVNANDARIKELVAAIYPDLIADLVEMARRQVHAHLLKLQSEGKVAGTSFTGVWRRV